VRGKKESAQISDDAIRDASKAVLSLSPGQLMKLATRMDIGPQVKRLKTLEQRQEAVRREFLDRKHRIIQTYV
jgi:hypothetical protein